MRSFRRAPAAKGLHHAYVAGLLEHTLGVVKLADRVAPLYPVHRDVLLAGLGAHVGLHLQKVDDAGETLMGADGKEERGNQRAPLGLEQTFARSPELPHSL